MARLFEIVPTTALIRRRDGLVERDDRLMYAIGEDAQEALDIVLQPYGENGTWYLDRLQVEAPGPWAFVALSREYDIADYIIAQRNKIEARDSFKFTFYQARKITSELFVPKVGCFVFLSKRAVATAAEHIRFLRPAWTLLRDQPDEKHWLEHDPFKWNRIMLRFFWFCRIFCGEPVPTSPENALVLLDEEPASVLAEAARAKICPGARACEKHSAAAHFDVPRTGSPSLVAGWIAPSH